MYVESGVDSVGVRLFGITRRFSLPAYRNQFNDFDFLGTGVDILTGTLEGHTAIGDIWH